MKKKLIAIMAAVLLLLLVPLCGCEKDQAADSDSPAEGDSGYTQVEITKMFADLQNDDEMANDTYVDENLEVTGVLYSIDYDGEFIQIYDEDDEVEEYITCHGTQDQLEDVEENVLFGAGMTVRGTVTEIDSTGYNMTLDSFEAVEEE